MKGGWGRPGWEGHTGNRPITSLHQLGYAAVSAVVVVMLTIVPADTHLKLVFDSLFPGDSWFDWDGLSCSGELKRTHTRKVTARNCICFSTSVCMCEQCDN